jgi:disulfide bond formation protein DsbB
MELLATVNTLVGIATLKAEILALILLVLYFKDDKRVNALIARFGLLAGFLIALGGTALSLVYSEYFGILPCTLCWFQRIPLYSALVVSMVALYVRDTRAYRYLIPLSGFGALVALYQHALQMWGAGILPCPATGGDCAKRFLFEFGHVTFPWAAFVSFALIIILMLYVRRAGRTEAASHR